MWKAKADTEPSINKLNGLFGLSVLLSILTGLVCLVLVPFN